MRKLLFGAKRILFFITKVTDPSLVHSIYVIEITYFIMSSIVLFIDLLS